jgi:hypothetical protein
MRLRLWLQHKKVKQLIAAPVPGSLEKKGDEGAIFYKVKGGIFFRLFLSNEPGTALSLRLWLSNTVKTNLEIGSTAASHLCII